MPNLARENGELRKRLAEAEKERDCLQRCHDSELGVCREHCPELRAAEAALEKAREALNAGYNLALLVRYVDVWNPAARDKALALCDRLSAALTPAAPAAKERKSASKAPCPLGGDPVGPTGICNNGDCRHNSRDNACLAALAPAAPAEKCEECGGTGMIETVYGPHDKETTPCPKCGRRVEDRT